MLHRSPASDPARANIPPQLLPGSASMYRPKFCAECGEKIIRLRWSLWTSRKFCESCAPRFFKEQLIQRLGASVAILLVGVVFGRTTRSTSPPLVIQRSQDSRLSSAASTQTGSNSSAPLVEEIYTCGARTKKGTPCSRRVHGPVRCWQHKGMPPMMAQEKLRIKD